MQGFNLFQKGKLIIAMKKANDKQLQMIVKIANSELERRKKRSVKSR